MPTLTIRLTRADRVRRGDFLRSEGRTLFVTETIRGADRTVLISADDEAGLCAWSRRCWSREAVLDVLVPESEKPAESLESAESPEPAGAAADPMMTVVPTAALDDLRRAERLATWGRPFNGMSELIAAVRVVLAESEARI
ncbi:hypothetical protein AM609_12185 [Actinomyces sp. oral taxon 414]|uniref:hypothetical protein n=1 Tax=Actinomyces sp. oral taxon 414 TaxID=712122 RepID=UPI0006B01CE0|nr:hypothetical protein [Actinomyces sp. oral taxon 414]ALD00022.1 hypothetical protein AM609_12185 [Actinomyces sp. oral taxon 414]